MRRLILFSTAALALCRAFAPLSAQAPVSAPTDGGYRLVPNWPKLPAGMYFGLKDAPPPPAEREAQAAARRAHGGGSDAAAAPAGQGPTNQPGISGLAIDQQDRIYVFNRGAKPVMVFDTDGKLVAVGRRSGDQRQEDQPVRGSTPARVDWDGNVYIIERDAHRIVKLSPKLDKFLLQLGTTEREGQRRDALRSAVGHRRPAQRQHHRHRRLRQQPRRAVRQDRQVHQAGRQGRRRPGRQGHRAPASGILPHKLAVDAHENLYIIDREGHRVQVFDKNLNYLREINERGWNPWDIGISRKGTDGFALHRRSRARARAQDVS